ncbi:MAG: hypothetical protein ACI33S_03855 [Bacilli bacterium]
MEEIRLNIGGFWENISNIESDIEHINWNIENHKDKKIVIDLPITYFDQTFFDRISDPNAIEFESRDGRRFKPKDILLINNKFENMINNIKNSELSQFEKFIAIYSFVANYKPYKLSENNEKYYDVGRSPYLFLKDDHINCVGMCQLLCILCRQVGINITMFADEEKEHAICYCFIKDNNYGIDGYFATDPTVDNINEEKIECDYTKMIGRILFNNDFEKFLNSNRQLSYPNDIVDINLFSKYISFLKTCNFFVENVDNPIDLLYSFRNEFKSKQNNISYDVIYSAILKVSQCGHISNINDNKDTIKNLLFIKEVKERTVIGESTNDLVESFIESSTSKRK